MASYFHELHWYVFVSDVYEKLHRNKICTERSAISHELPWHVFALKTSKKQYMSTSHIWISFLLPWFQGTHEKMLLAIDREMRQCQLSKHNLVAAILKQDIEMPMENYMIKNLSYHYLALGNLKLRSLKIMDLERYLLPCSFSLPSPSFPLCAAALVEAAAAILFLTASGRRFARRRRRRHRPRGGHEARSRNPRSA